MLIKEEELVEEIVVTFPVEIIIIIIIICDLNIY